MKKSRRKFITNISAYAATVGFSSFFSTAYGKDLLEVINQENNLDFEQMPNEEFWRKVRDGFSVSLTHVNLNNAGVSPSPKVVQEAVEYYNKLSNEMPTVSMNRIVGQGKESVRRSLANLAGCSPEEIAINRNASEGLETIVFGLELKKGDEVVLSKYDYPSIIHAWQQREKRDGIVLKWVDFEFPMEDNSLMVKSFESQFSNKTKLVQITHMINWCGQILPVKEIAATARKRGIEVLVDGAQTFGAIDFNIPDLDCDYFGTSLHKWLCAPFGTGMLYVKKDKIANVFPLFGAVDPDGADIRKFEHLGTRSISIERSIQHAVEFHELIGIKRKADRLFYLKNYWATQLQDLDRVRLNTSLKREFSGAIGHIQIEGIENLPYFTRALFNNHQIHTVAIVQGHLRGLRISPNIYTLESELDRFVEVFKKVLKDF